MRNFVTPIIAAAAMAAFALPAYAQSEGAAAAAETSPSASSTAPAETGSAAPASTTSAAPTLSVGQPVKDKTGAVIGQIAELKPSAGGQTATVKMGEQTFAVDAQSFAVQNGAAVINATKAELQSMIASAGKGG